MKSYGEWLVSSPDTVRGAVFQANEQLNNGKLQEAMKFAEHARIRATPSTPAEDWSELRKLNKRLNSRESDFR